MRFPDDVTVVRPTGTDEYGNPGNSFDLTDEVEVRGFRVQPDLLLLPPSADVQDGDRVRVNGGTFDADPTEVRSPSKRVLWTVALKEVEV